MTQPGGNSRRAVLRGLAVAGLTLATAACGYRPMYAGGARNSAVSRQLAAVRIGIAQDRVGQIMRTEIEQEAAAAGRGVAKEYDLTFATSLRSTELGIAKDATATRANITYTVTYTLSRGDEMLLRQTVNAIASYNILDDQYAAVVSRESAETRTARDVAQQIVNRLSAWFAEQGGA
jgi:LPS-assembly lipoprotein